MPDNYKYTWRIEGTLVNKAKDYIEGREKRHFPRWKSKKGVNVLYFTDQNETGVACLLDISKKGLKIGVDPEFKGKIIRLRVLSRKPVTLEVNEVHREPYAIGLQVTALSKKTGE